MKNKIEKTRRRRRHVPTISLRCPCPWRPRVPCTVKCSEENLTSIFLVLFVKDLSEIRYFFKVWNCSSHFPIVARCACSIYNYCGGDVYYPLFIASMSCYLLLGVGLLLILQCNYDYRKVSCAEPFWWDLSNLLRWGISIIFLLNFPL